ncbi:hypothetical protein BROUX41_006484 [Berkeleyomyces rouxiae]|uniref:uncharacterized protein n=1 Tax=Berkeleyomyces rouxiae TaxID=2035830 RepID=UPI003B75E485
MPHTMSPSPTPSLSEPAFNFDPQTLYLLVSAASPPPSSASPAPPHRWALIISRSTSEGDLLEPTEASHQRWAFSSTPQTAAQIEARAASGALLLVLRLAEVEEMLRPALCSRVGRVLITKTNSHGDEFSSRVWCQQVLAELENEGYIDLNMTADKIDAEALRKASANQPLPMQKRLLEQTSKAFVQYDKTPAV